MFKELKTTMLKRRKIQHQSLNRLSNTVAEMKNSLKWFNRWYKLWEQLINKLKDEQIKQFEEQRGKKMRISENMGHD